MLLVITQSLWYFFLSLETIITIPIVFLCLAFVLMNGVFLFAMIDKQRKKQDRFFRFETEFKWIEPNSLYIPFEFNLMICNYYSLRLCIFGKGFQFQFKWFDVVTAMNLNSEPKKEEQLIAKKEDAKKSESKDQKSPPKNNPKPKKEKPVKENVLVEKDIRHESPESGVQQKKEGFGEKDSPLESGKTVESDTNNVNDKSKIKE